MTDDEAIARALDEATGQRQRAGSAAGGGPTRD
jgi:hypothetical protein